MNEQFVKYKDLKTINKISDKYANEELIGLPNTGNTLIGKYLTNLNELEFSDKVMIRKSLKEKLENVDKELKKINKNYQLIVAYGYRALSKQKNILTRK